MCDCQRTLFVITHEGDGFTAKGCYITYEETTDGFLSQVVLQATEVNLGYAILKSGVSKTKEEAQASVPEHLRITRERIVQAFQNVNYIDLRKEDPPS